MTGVWYVLTPAGKTKPPQASYPTADDAWLAAARVVTAARKPRRDRGIPGGKRGDAAPPPRV